MCFGSFFTKGATEARTWLYVDDGEFRLRMVLVGWRRSSMSIAGVDRSSAFNKERIYKTRGKSIKIRFSLV